MQYFKHKGKVYVHSSHICITQADDADTLTLTAPFHWDGTDIPTGFTWNGASSPNTPLARFIAPKFYKNIKASCIHDYLCGIAKTKEERLQADNAYFLAKKYIEHDHNWISKLSWLGVRIGAFFGIGSNF